MREDVFGPLLTMYPLSKDLAFIDRMLLETSSGGVTVNGWAAHWFEPRLPFRGGNESGIGRYRGVHGFKEPSQERAMLTIPAVVWTPRSRQH